MTNIPNYIAFRNVCDGDIQPTCMTSELEYDNSDLFLNLNKRNDVSFKNMWLYILESNTDDVNMKLFDPNQEAFSNITYAYFNNNDIQQKEIKKIDFNVYLKKPNSQNKFENSQRFKWNRTYKPNQHRKPCM